jgi:hypothetical protein
MIPIVKVSFLGKLSLVHFLIRSDACKFIRDHLDKRWRLFAEYIHWTAFALDPWFRDISIDSDDYALAEYFLNKFSDNETEQEEVRNDLIAFCLCQNIFSQVQSYFIIIDNVDPVVFWRRLLASSGKNRKIVRIALDVLSLPASCAAVERSFSCVRRIHTWQRNRLAPETLATSYTSTYKKGWLVLTVQDVLFYASKKKARIKYNMLILIN